MIASLSAVLPAFRAPSYGRFAALKGALHNCAGSSASLAPHAPAGRPTPAPASAVTSLTAQQRQVTAHNTASALSGYPPVLRWLRRRRGQYTATPPETAPRRSLGANSQLRKDTGGSPSSLRSLRKPALVSHSSHSLRLTLRFRFATRALLSFFPPLKPLGFGGGRRGSYAYCWS